MVSEAPAEAIRITLLVTIELERLGVPYVVAGSLASSLHGLTSRCAGPLVGLRRDADHFRLQLSPIQVAMWPHRV
jgi:hypothetical protein